MKDMEMTLSCFYANRYMKTNKHACYVSYTKAPIQPSLVALAKHFALASFPDFYVPCTASDIKAWERVTLPQCCNNI